MKGYVYLDNDLNLNVRSKEFIDIQDPGFWGRNAHLIDTVWSFDSDNRESMIKLLTSLKSRELQMDPVRNFCLQINFDLDAFLKEVRFKVPLFVNKVVEETNSNSSIPNKNNYD